MGEGAGSHPERRRNSQWEGGGGFAPPLARGRWPLGTPQRPWWSRGLGASGGAREGPCLLVRAMAAGQAGGAAQ